MTTAAATLAPDSGGASASTGMAGSVRWLLSDTATLTRRNLLAVTRIPEALVVSTVQPIMFVLLFRYVFGGAIHTDAELRELPDARDLRADGDVRGGGPASAWPRTSPRGNRPLTVLPMSRGAVLLGHLIADLGPSSSCSW